MCRNLFSPLVDLTTLLSAMLNFKTRYLVIASMGTINVIRISSASCFYISAPYCKDSMIRHPTNRVVGTPKYAPEKWLSINISDYNQLIVFHIHAYQRFQHCFYNSVAMLSSNMVVAI